MAKAMLFESTTREDLGGRSSGFMVAMASLMLPISLFQLAQVGSILWKQSGQHIHNGNPGNVGIRTTTPAEALEVSGSIQISGQGSRLLFPDGSEQSTAAPSVGIVPSGYSILSDSASSPFGYSFVDVIETGGTWSSKELMPTGRAFPAACVHDGTIYVIGGTGDGVANEVYDPSAETWAVRAPLPGPRAYAAAATVGEVIYVIGGRDTSTWVPTNEAYDPASDRWTTKSPMIGERSAVAAATIDGKIFVIGGENSFGPINSNQVYDPQSDSWLRLSNMPTPRSYAVAAAVDGRIYVIGGSQNAGPSGANEEYDPGSNQWRSRAPLPTPRYGSGVAVVGGMIYVMGGSSGSVVEVYDPATDSWAGAVPLLTGRRGLVGVFDGKRIHAIGGVWPNGNGRVIESFLSPKTFFVHRRN